MGEVLVPYLFEVAFGHPISPCGTATAVSSDVIIGVLQPSLGIEKTVEVIESMIRIVHSFQIELSLHFTNIHGYLPPLLLWLPLH